MKLIYVLIIASLFSCSKTNTATTQQAQEIVSDLDSITFDAQKTTTQQSPDIIDLGTTIPGQSIERQVAITNNSGKTISLSLDDLSQKLTASNGMINLNSTNCSTTLKTGKSCSLFLRLNHVESISAEIYTAGISTQISSDSSNENYGKIFITAQKGSTVAQETPSVSFYELGTILSTTASNSIRLFIRNTGNQTVDLSNITIPSPWKLVASSCSAVKVGKACFLDLALDTTKTTNMTSIVSTITIGSSSFTLKVGSATATTCASGYILSSGSCIVSALSPNSSIDLSTTILAYYPFNGITQSELFIDTSGNNHTLSAESDSILPTIITYSSIYKQALSNFNTFTVMRAIHVLANVGSNPFTIEMNMSFVSGSEQAFLEYGEKDNVDSDMFFHINNNQLHAYVLGHNKYFDISDKMDDHIVHKIVLQRSSPTLFEIYLDQSLLGSISLNSESINDQTTSALVLGNNKKTGTWGDMGYKGYIDEVKVYSGRKYSDASLPSGAIGCIANYAYNSSNVCEKTLSSEPLIAYYPLEGSITGAFSGLTESGILTSIYSDMTGNNFTLQTLGGVLSAETYDGTYGQALLNFTNTSFLYADNVLNSVGANPFTIEMNLSFTQGGTQAFLEYGGRDRQSGEFYFHYNSDNTISGSIKNHDFSFALPESMLDSVPVHKFILQRTSSTSAEVYLDGSLLGTITLRGESIAINKSLVIGNNRAPEFYGSMGFQGYIDEIKVYNQRMYNETNQPSTGIIGCVKGFEINPFNTTQCWPSGNNAGTGLGF